MQGKKILKHMTDVAAQAGDTLAKQTLLELCGEHRVLIEHHAGVLEYSRKVVRVKVRFGAIQIEGTNLIICKMMADQLVVMGDVNSIMLLKGTEK